MTLPKGIDLDQYKTQAKDLLRQIRAKNSEALSRLRDGLIVSNREWTRPRQIVHPLASTEE